MDKANFVTRMNLGKSQRRDLEKLCVFEMKREYVETLIEEQYAMDNNIVGQNNAILEKLDFPLVFQGFPHGLLNDDKRETVKSSGFSSRSSTLNHSTFSEEGLNYEGTSSQRKLIDSRAEYDDYEQSQTSSNLLDSSMNFKIVSECEKKERNTSCRRISVEPVVSSVPAGMKNSFSTLSPTESFAEALRPKDTCVGPIDLTLVASKGLSLQTTCSLSPQSQTLQKGLEVTTMSPSSILTTSPITTTSCFSSSNGESACDIKTCSQFVTSPRRSLETLDVASTYSDKEELQISNSVVSSLQNCVDSDAEEGFIDVDDTGNPEYRSEQWLPGIQQGWINSPKGTSNCEKSTETGLTGPNVHIPVQSKRKPVNFDGALFKDHVGGAKHCKHDVVNSDGAERMNRINRNIANHLYECNNQNGELPNQSISSGSTNPQTKAGEQWLPFRKEQGQRKSHMTNNVMRTNSVPLDSFPSNFHIPIPTVPSNHSFLGTQRPPLWNPMFGFQRVPTPQTASSAISPSFPCLASVSHSNDLLPDNYSFEHCQDKHERSSSYGPKSKFLVSSTITSLPLSSKASAPSKTESCLGHSNRNIYPPQTASSSETIVPDHLKIIGKAQPNLSSAPKKTPLGKLPRTEINTNEGLAEYFKLLFNPDEYKSSDKINKSTSGLGMVRSSDPKVSKSRLWVPDALPEMGSQRTTVSSDNKGPKESFPSVIQKPADKVISIDLTMDSCDEEEVDNVDALREGQIKCADSLPSLEKTGLLPVSVVDELWTGSSKECLNSEVVMTCSDNNVGSALLSDMNGLKAMDSVSIVPTKVPYVPKFFQSLRRGDVEKTGALEDVHRWSGGAMIGGDDVNDTSGKEDNEGECENHVRKGNENQKSEKDMKVLDAIEIIIKSRLEGGAMDLSMETTSVNSLFEEKLNGVKSSCGCTHRRRRPTLSRSLLAHRNALQRAAQKQAQAAAAFKRPVVPKYVPRKEAAFSDVISEAKGQNKMPPLPKVSYSRKPKDTLQSKRCGPVSMNDYNGKTQSRGKEAIPEKANSWENGNGHNVEDQKLPNISNFSNSSFAKSQLPFLLPEYPPFSLLPVQKMYFDYFSQKRSLDFDQNQFCFPTPVPLKRQRIFFDEGQNLTFPPLCLV